MKNMPNKFRRSSTKDPTLFTSVSNNLTENSKLVKNAVNSSKFLVNTVVNSSKKVMIPISKILDYVAVSIITVFIYRSAQIYM